MFAKLLKHEWRATGGILGVLSLCALGAGAVGGLMLRLLVEAAENSRSNPLNAFSPSVLLFVGLGLVVYSVGGSILLYHRFYKTKFTDEGYLTFTLPVKSSEIFLSSLVNTLIWSLIIILVVCASVFIIAAIGFWEQLVELDILEELEYLLEELNAEAILNLALGAVNSVCTIVLVMSCITMGAVAAKKHKLLAAVGIFYGASTVKNTMSTIIMVTLMNDVESFQGAITASTVSNAAMGILFAVGGYFLSVYLMNHKLNLP